MTKKERKAQYMREWHAKNPGYRAKYQKEWYAKHPGYNYELSKRCRDKKPDKYKELDRATQYRNDYDITIEWYENELRKQGGVCAICGQPPRRKRLSVDHNHKTGANRGLLCGPCNTALNRVESVSEWGTKAESYLAKYGY